MSPPPGQDAASALKAQNRRSTSGSASPRPPQAGDGTKGPKASAAASNVNAKQSTVPTNVHYTLLIKLPFARGDFEDPPQVEWDATKDKKLWKIISKNSKSADIDWAQHAQEFGVTQPFLLQQAAWLYERHFQHVKAQMTKLRSTNAPTPVQQQGGNANQQAAVAGGVPMKRLGSGGGASRAPSALSIRSRDSPVPRGEVTAAGSSTGRPELSRTPSAATVTQSRHFLPPASPRQPVQRSFRGGAAGSSRRNEATPLPPADEAAPSPPASPSTTSSSSSDSEIEPPIRQSQLFRRPPTFQRQKKTTTNLSNVDDIGEDSDDDDSSTFLPFASKADPGPAARREDPSATLRETNTPPRTRAHPSTFAAGQQGPSSRVPAATTGTPKGKGRAPLPRMESSASSNSSAAPPSSASATPAGGAGEAGQAPHRRVDALSPRHRAELARLSPRRSASGQGSDGTPSMGSSFSDLDDTSITQSALEEALASNFRHGGASRLSTISHAFGSRLYGRGGGGGGQGQGQN